jgi:FkbM family methyltransferase
MNVYLDFGSNKFQGLMEFEKKLNMNCEWAVYCYEANPLICELHETQSQLAIFKKKYKFFELINAAISCDENPKLLSLPSYGEKGKEKVDFQSSTLLESELPFDETKKFWTSNFDFESNRFKLTKTEVNCLDINLVLQNLHNKFGDCNIFIKMDIEGGEYVVLDRLMESNLLRLINEIHIEWHHRFFSIKDRAGKKLFENEVKKFLSSNSVKVFNHH